MTINKKIGIHTDILNIFSNAQIAQLVEQWTEDPCVPSSSLGLGMGNSLKRWYRQVVRPWIANPLSPVQIWVPPLITFSIVCLKHTIENLHRGRGGMVDTTDLNFEH